MTQSIVKPDQTNQNHIRTSTLLTIVQKCDEQQKKKANDAVNSLTRSDQSESYSNISSSVNNSTKV